MTASYERLGVGYAQGRRADPRWQTAIDAVLGEASTVLNVGAGTGSYEPAERFVLAVEPAPTMIRQRGLQAAPVVQARAEALPVADGRFDVAMALVTLHHWNDWRAGLREMRRVAARVLVLHFDPVLHGDCDGARISTLPVPWDCVDGFLPAYWRRPEAYLDPPLRRSMSGLQLLAPGVLRRGIDALRLDLHDGTWRRRNADLLERDELDVGWRLITTE